MKSNIKSIINLVFVLILITVAGFSMLKRHVKTDEVGNKKVDSDVICYVDAARSMAQGQDIYLKPGTSERNSYTYPPFYAFLNIPLTLLPNSAIDIGWYALNIFMISTVIFLCYFLFTNENLWRQSLKTKWYFIGLSIFLSIRYLIRNFQDSNANILLLFLVILSIFMYYRKHNAWWFALIGIAGAIKLYPLLFLVYFLAKKDFKAILIIIGTFTFASLLPVLLIGFNQYFTFIHQFFQYANEMFSPLGTTVENYSIWGTITRLFSHNPSFVMGNKEVFVNLFNMNTNVLKLIVYLVNACVVIYIYFHVRKQKTYVNKYVQHSEWIIVLLLMHFTSVLIEEHHVVSFLVAYLYLLVGYKNIRLLPKYLYYLVIFSGIFSIFTTHDIMVPLIGKEAFMRMLSYSIPILPIGIFLIVCLHYIPLSLNSKSYKTIKI